MQFNYIDLNATLVTKPNIIDFHGEKYDWDKYEYIPYTQKALQYDVQFLSFNPLIKSKKGKPATLTCIQLISDKLSKSEIDKRLSKFVVGTKMMIYGEPLFEDDGTRPIENFETKVLVKAVEIGISKDTREVIDFPETGDSLLGEIEISHGVIDNLRVIERNGKKFFHFKLIMSDNNNGSNIIECFFEGNSIRPWFKNDKAIAILGNLFLKNSRKGGISHDVLAISVQGYKNSSYVNYWVTE